MNIHALSTLSSKDSATFDAAEQYHLRKVSELLSNWKTDPSMKTVIHLKVGYNSCVECAHLRMRSSPHFTKAVLTFFPDVLMALSERRREMAQDMSTSLVDLIVANEDLGVITQQEKGEKALTWFCLTHAFMQTWSGSHGFSEKFKTLLHTWTGQQLAANIRPTLDVVTSLLYGPACWELYGINNDEEDDEVVAACIRDILELNLPLTFKKQDSPIQLIIPNDVTV